MDRLSIVYAVFELFWTIFLFMFILYFVPYLYIQGRSRFEDNLQLFFGAIIGSSFIIVIGMHLAIMTNLIDPMSVKLMTLFVLIWIGYLHNKIKSNEEISLIKTGYLELLDLLDSQLSTKERLVFVFSNLTHSIRNSISVIGQKIKSSPLLILLNAITFGSAFFVRSYHAVSYFTYPASDTYVQLVWIKYANDNRLYTDGLAPHGMHVILSYMSTLYNVNAYDLVRFLGPLIGLIIIASIYNFVKLHFKGNRYAPWFAVSVYVFVSILPTGYWRQTTVLPLEYALMFMLPALSYMIVYIRNGHIRDLRLAAMGLSLTFFMSVPVGIFTLINLLLIAVLNAKKLFKASSLKNTSIYYLSALAAPFMPIVFYVLIGSHFNAVFVLEIKRLLQLPFEMITNPLQTLVANEEIAAILSIYIAIIAGLLFSKLIRFRSEKYRVITPMICVVILIAFIGLNGVNIPKTYQYEYEQAALGYNALLQEVDRGTMTLIAPQEQYQQIIGFGYHYHLWRLMTEQTDQKIEKIEIPTKNIFIFVEKIPFGSKQKVNLADASTVLPIISGDLTRYYSDYRNIIESKAYYWSEAFRKQYQDQVSVFYEDEVFKIYWIKQDINAPLNLKTGMPQEVFIK